jgi:hypothetical protein
MVGNFLRRLHLDSSATVDKLWILLNDIGMTRHAEATAEVREPELSSKFVHLTIRSHTPLVLQITLTNTAKLYGTTL